jgi:gas vesicle protein
MTSNDEMKCFWMGLGIGVAAGVLFAPKSGAETRQFIQSKTMEGTDYLKNQATQAVKEGSEYVKNQAAQVANAASEAVERSSKTIRHKKENVMAAVDAGKAAYDEATKTTPAFN